VVHYFIAYMAVQANSTVVTHQNPVYPCNFCCDFIGVIFFLINSNGCERVDKI
jgi:NADH:ubiquinone oxidoreductase subunit 6 (subunit J)